MLIADKYDFKSNISKYKGKYYQVNNSNKINSNSQKINFEKKIPIKKTFLKSIPIPELELRVSSNSGMELTTCLKYIHDNILSLCTTATVMNSIIELKQAYVCGAFVGRGFYPCTILSSRCFQYNT